jgi:hypothetical protein
MSRRKDPRTTEQKRFDLLRSIAAWIRVWVGWSQDKKDIELSSSWQRGAGIGSAALTWLKAQGYVRTGEGKEVVGGGRAPVISEAGLAWLKERSCEGCGDGPLPLVGQTKCAKCLDAVLSAPSPSTT